MKGRKRHIVVDREGNVLVVVVHEANLQDYHGARTVFTRLQHMPLPRLQKIWADAIYKGDKTLQAWVKERFGWELEVVEREGLVASEKRRGYKPALEKLDKDKYADFLARSNVPSALLTPGRWLKALVTEAGAQGLTVRFGDKYGFIPAGEIGWAKVAPSVTASAPQPA